MKKIDHKHEFDGKQDRNFYQKPFDEVTDPLPQIDDVSASMSEKHTDKENTSENNESDKERAWEIGSYANDINEEDRRDESDSTRDWDAEHNRTGRHK